MHYVNDRDIRGYERPGACNHWPVGQARCDGRTVQADDRPTHQRICHTTHFPRAMEGAEGHAGRPRSGRRLTPSQPNRLTVSHRRESGERGAKSTASPLPLSGPHGLQLARRRPMRLHRLSEGRVVIVSRDFIQRFATKGRLKPAQAGKSRAFRRDTPDPGNEWHLRHVESPGSQTFRSNLAMVERYLGNLNEARSLLQKAYDIAVPRLGPEHTTSKRIAAWLATVQ